MIILCQDGLTTVFPYNFTAVICAKEKTEWKILCYTGELPIEIATYSTESQAKEVYADLFTAMVSTHNHYIMPQDEALESIEQPPNSLRLV